MSATACSQQATSGTEMFNHRRVRERDRHPRESIKFKDPQLCLRHPLSISLRAPVTPATTCCQGHWCSGLPQLSLVLPLGVCLLTLARKSFFIPSLKENFSQRKVSVQAGDIYFHSNISSEAGLYLINKEFILPKSTFFFQNSVVSSACLFQFGV